MGIPQRTRRITTRSNAPRTSARNLAAELRDVGIDSLEALMRVGFWDAWLQLRRANPGARRRAGVPRARGRRGRRALEPPAAARCARTSASA